MGTDIHLCIEQKVDGAWRYLGTTEGWYEEDGKDPTPSPGIIDPSVLETLGGRCYMFFAIIAGIRNGFGFAGTPTHTPLEPIQEDRGYPEDMGHHHAHRAGHCHQAPEPARDEASGWVTLQEILDFDWERELQHTGVINAWEYKHWVADGRGEPRTWCGGVGGARVKNLTNEQMDIIIKSAEDSDMRKLGAPDFGNKEAMEFLKAAGVDTKELDAYYTRVQWTENLKEAISYHYEAIQTLAQLGDPKNIRLVFYFDS